MDFQFDVEPIRVLEATVEAAVPEARKRARDGVKKTTFEIEARGKVNAAVRTGFMRNSITSDFRGSNADIAVGETGPEAFYGKFVEDGTERQAPQPFMGPAADEVEPSFVEAMTDFDPFGGMR